MLLIQHPFFIKSVGALSYERIEEAIDINYKGMVYVLKAYNYLEKSRGLLVFYTSSSYTRGRMNYSIYSSTKCATVNFVQV
jgi:2-C-methyl-D-erythritol 4-phosphate cytidylyltransferase